MALQVDTPTAINVAEFVENAYPLLARHALHRNDAKCGWQLDVLSNSNDLCVLLVGRIARYRLLVHGGYGVGGGLMVFAPGGIVW